MITNSKEFYKELDQKYASKNMDQVEKYLITMAQSTKPCCGKFNEVYLACLSELGGLYRGISKYEKSVTAFTEAGYILKSYYGSDSIEYATNLNNLAGTYRQMGNTTDALETFKKSQEIFEINGDTENNFLYASVLNNVALLYVGTKDYYNALINMNKAIDIIEKLDEYEEELATSYANLAAIYISTKDEENALFYVNKAIAIFKERAENPHYLSALNIFAQLKYNRGEYEEAIDILKKVEQGIQGYYGRNADYASVCTSIRTVYEKIGMVTQAIEYAEKAYETYQNIFTNKNNLTIRAKEELDKLKM